MIGIPRHCRFRKVSYFNFSKQFDFYSLIVPCNPPFNITIGVIDSVSINFSWIQPHCRDGKYVYIMYKKVSDKSMGNWSIHGVKNGGKKDTMLRYLEQGKHYKGYLLQSTVHGNGPPSQVVYFRTIIGSRFISFQKDNILDWILIFSFHLYSNV